MAGSNKYWAKNNPNDRIWWNDDPDIIGEWEFSFDRKTSFFMYQDYPWKLTPEQKKIFDQENPFWANYFKDRQ